MSTTSVSVSVSPSLDLNTGGPHASSSVEPIVIAISISSTVVISVTAIISSVYLIRRSKRRHPIKRLLQKSIPVANDSSSKSPLDLMETYTNETMIRYGPNFFMPGHLLLKMGDDVRIIGNLAEGGGGSVMLAQLLNPSGHYVEDDVVLKILKGK